MRIRDFGGENARYRMTLILMCVGLVMYIAGLLMIFISEVMPVKYIGALFAMAAHVPYGIGVVKSGILS